MQIGKKTPETSENEEQKIILLLSERGAEDPETIRLMTEWIEKEQGLVEASAPNDVMPGIRLNLRIARIYLAAGLIEVAKKCYSDVLYQAQMGEKDELCVEIEKEMEKNSL